MIYITVLSPITVVDPVILSQSAPTFDLLMSIFRADDPMILDQMRTKTVDTCVGLEPLTKDIAKAPFPISYCWKDRD